MAAKVRHTKDRIATQICFSAKIFGHTADDSLALHEHKWLWGGGGGGEFSRLNPKAPKYLSAYPATYSVIIKLK